MEKEGDEGGAGGRKLSFLIEKATNSTAQEVDPRLLKAIKHVVRSSDDQVRFAVEALMEKMKKNHSQVRYLTLLIIDELFMRSKLFRSLLVVKFDQFLSLSVGFRSNLPLPPPASIASRLRSKGIEFLEKWNDSFGVHYRQLRLGFDYLKNTLKFQFPNRLENTARLQRERMEREVRSKEILTSKFQTLKDNFPLIKNEIESTMHEIEECVKIVRSEEDTFEPAGVVLDESAEEIRNSSLIQIRLAALREGEKLHENSENKAVFDMLRELYKLLVSRHLPAVQDWASVLVRVDPTDTRSRDSLLKEFIDIRNNLLSLKKRCELLGISLNTSTNEEDEDIWEEGKIEVYSNKASGASGKHGENIFSIKVDKTLERKNEPEHQKAIRSRCEALEHADDSSDSTCLKKKLQVEAPILAWGSYLDSWGTKRDALANQRGLEFESHWGRVDHDAVIPAEKIAELHVQASVYEEQLGEIRPCLAPLAKGGLCHRRDLRICPFHGPIILRDQEGNPINKNPSTGEDAEDEAIPQNADFDVDGELDIKKVAKQAVKNVRTRDHEEERKQKALKKAKVRAHNETVLREAAVASTSRSESIVEDLETVIKGKNTLASMLKKKVTTKDRIAEKLLNSRTTDAAIRQLRQGEEASYRENYPNQW
ncbi:UV-stimulated scaffold protein A homolog [Aristolochia californica]|uniref:UV-stimulated scaffold protein A homolog n=1 Tax=Aristolochia californica TaxID=171875 RepID=UPI0035DCF3DF